MKKIYFITSFCFIANIVFAQSIERQVIGATGSTITDGSTMTMSFTVGEVITTSLTNGTLIWCISVIN